MRSLHINMHHIENKMTFISSITSWLLVIHAFPVGWVYKSNAFFQKVNRPLTQPTLGYTFDIK